MTLSARFGEFTAALCADELPAEVATVLHRRLLDTAGNALAAAVTGDGRRAIALARRWSGPAEATAIGVGARLPARTAALLHGTLAHTLDFDDTHLPSVLHPSASILPAVLAAAEAEGASVAELRAAAAAGYEVCVRLGTAGQDGRETSSAFFERGWHATSICGALGAAAAAARLMGLPAAGVADAIGIAASLAGGLLEGNRAGGTVKRLHCGWAAHAGLSAAEMARAGFSAPSTALEGRLGFFRAFLGESPDPRTLLADLGVAWCQRAIAFKPYPCNHFLHPVIEGARALGRRVAVGEIEAVEVGVPLPVLKTIAEPIDEKRRPRSGYQAMFSGPFATALALLGAGGRGPGLADFSDVRATDPAALALAARVTFFADEECGRIFPRDLPAVVRVRTGGGVWHTERVPATRGGPGCPLSKNELLDKFHDNAARAVPEPVARALAAELLDEQDRPAARLLAPLADVHLAASSS